MISQYTTVHRNGPVPDHIKTGKLLASYLINKIKGHSSRILTKFQRHWKFSLLCVLLRLSQKLCIINNYHGSGWLSHVSYIFHQPISWLAADSCADRVDSKESLLFCSDWSCSLRNMISLDNLFSVSCSCFCKVVNCSNVDATLDSASLWAYREIIYNKMIYSIMGNIWIILLIHYRFLKIYMWNYRVTFTRSLLHFLKILLWNLWQPMLFFNSVVTQKLATCLIVDTIYGPCAI